MHVGVHYIDFLPGPAERLGPTLAATAKAADDAGVEVFSLADHLFQMEGVGAATDPFLEGYTSLGYLAAATERITLSMLVTGVTYRYPGVLAKAMTTLDVLAGGRTMLGLGAAWYDREHHALGIPYPPLGDRFEMLEETLQICLQMWSENDGPFVGTHYRLAETICQPQPIRRPPILLGGSGEKKTLRLVAQYADVWHSTAALEELPHKLDVLRRHCDTVGRDMNEIRLAATILDDPFGDIDAYLRGMDRYGELGFDPITTGPLPGNPNPVGWVNRLGDEVLPRLR
ncbi:LLM class F420-dependent oxidoreductase [Mycolicibacterium sp. CBM1]